MVKDISAKMRKVVVIVKLVLRFSLCKACVRLAGICQQKRNGILYFCQSVAWMLLAEILNLERVGVAMGMVGMRMAFLHFRLVKNLLMEYMISSIPLIAIRLFGVLLNMIQRVFLVRTCPIMKIK